MCSSAFRTRGWAWRRLCASECSSRSSPRNQRARGPARAWQRCWDPTQADTDDETFSRGGEQIVREPTRRMWLEEGVHLIEKPFAVEDLFRCVREVLDGDG